MNWKWTSKKKIQSECVKHIPSSTECSCIFIFSDLNIIFLSAGSFFYLPWSKCKWLCWLFRHWQRAKQWHQRGKCESAVARLLLFGVLHKELLLIYLSKASKIESASNNNFLAALRSFLKQHRKRKKKYYRSTILFFLEMLYSVKSPFYHGYETNFPQSTDLCFQSNQIRMDVRIGYIYWYFHFKDKNTSGQAHLY